MPTEPNSSEAIRNIVATEIRNYFKGKWKILAGVGTTLAAALGFLGLAQAKGWVDLAHLLFDKEVSRVVNDQTHTDSFKAALAESLRNVVGASYTGNFVLTDKGVDQYIPFYANEGNDVWALVQVGYRGTGARPEVKILVDSSPIPPDLISKVTAP